MRVELQFLIKPLNLSSVFPVHKICQSKPSRAQNCFGIHLTLLEYFYDRPDLPSFGFGMDAPTVMNLASQVLM